MASHPKKGIDALSPMEILCCLVASHPGLLRDNIDVDGAELMSQLSRLLGRLSSKDLAQLEMIIM